MKRWKRYSTTTSWLPPPFPPSYFNLTENLHRYTMYLFNCGIYLGLVLCSLEVNTIEAGANRVLNVAATESIAAAVFASSSGSSYTKNQGVKLSITGLDYLNESLIHRIDLTLKKASAFDESSSYSVENGADLPIKVSKQVFASPDPSNVFSIASVDIFTQETHGFFQTNGKEFNASGTIYTMKQKKGKSVETALANPVKATTWHCGVDELNSNSIFEPSSSEDVFAIPSNDEDTRALKEHDHSQDHHLFDLTSFPKSVRGAEGMVGRHLYCKKS